MSTTTSSPSDEVGPPVRVVPYAVCRGKGSGCKSPVPTASSGVPALVPPVNDGVVSTSMLTATLTSSVSCPLLVVISVPATGVGPTVDIVSSLSAALNPANTALVDPPYTGPNCHVVATALANPASAGVMPVTSTRPPCKDTFKVHDFE